MDKIGKADNFCVYFSLGWIQISSEVFPTVRKPNVINYDVVFVSRYRTRAIIGRSRFEAALVYKPRILGLKSEEFPFLVHKLSVI